MLNTKVEILWQIGCFASFRLNSRRAKRDWGARGGWCSNNPSGECKFAPNHSLGVLCKMFITVLCFVLPPILLRDWIYWKYSLQLFTSNIYLETLLWDPPSFEFDNLWIITRELSGNWVPGWYQHIQLTQLPYIHICIFCMRLSYYENPEHSCTNMGHYSQPAAEKTSDIALGKYLSYEHMQPWNRILSESVKHNFCPKKRRDWCSRADSMFGLWFLTMGRSWDGGDFKSWIYSYAMHICGVFTWKEERSTSQGLYLLVWITLELLYLVLHLLLLLYLDLLYTVEYCKGKGKRIILQHIWTIWNPPEDNGNSVKCTNIWQCA